MKKSLLALAVVVVGVFSASAARADVIAGPTLTTAVGLYHYSGLDFTATVNSTLTSFTFDNQGLADTVELVNSAGTVLDSIATPSGDTSDTVSVSWSLTAGIEYYLLQSTASNGLYTSWGSAAPSDSQIALVDTGIFSSSPDSDLFSFGGPTGNGTAYWATFDNITTTGSATNAPEPSSLLLLGAGLLGLLVVRRSKFTRSHSLA